MERKLRELAPTAELSGFTVQKMVRRPHARETIVGVTVDSVFGPVILFGHGGVAVEVIRDRAISLPPLNEPLAAQLVSRTGIARLLDGYRGRPPANRGALHLTLVQVSQLIVDVAEIMELDINPLLVDESGVIALDARIRVAASPSAGAQRLAIQPYPVEHEEQAGFDGREVLIRPIRPEDEAQHARFLSRIDPQDLQLRFFHAVKSLPRSALARFTQIDYDREMAFIAVAAGSGGAPETLGVVRACSDPDGVNAEFAILVRSDLKGRGLGMFLMKKIVAYCRGRGIARLAGEVLSGNSRMLDLARQLGFVVAPGEGGVCRVVLDLVEAKAKAAAPR
jgi:acetyltransferase